MTLNILIVDDELPARRRLADVLADVRDSLPNAVVGEAANGSEAVALATKLKPDVVFLDMQMPRMGGLETARQLAALDPAPPVVFVTAHDEFAVDAFEVNATDYLMKPVRAERLAAALRKVAARQSGNANPVAAAASVAPAALPSGVRAHLPISERGKLTLVPIMEVLFMRAELKYVTVRTAAKEFLVEESLVHLEEEFAQVFVRVHRNAIVARHAITGFEKAHASDEQDAQWHVVLRGTEERLPVSRRQWSTVKEIVKGA
jgi:two-component system, LytTR family, response regulator AlgR